MTTRMAIEQDTSPGETTVTTPAAITEQMSTDSTVERSTREAETSTYVEDVVFTTESTTTGHTFTVLYDDVMTSTANDATLRRTTEKETSSKDGRVLDLTSDQYKGIVISTTYTDPETTVKVFDDITTRQTGNVAHSTTARKLVTEDSGVITQDNEVMSTTEQPVPRTVRQITRSEPLLPDTTQHLTDRTDVTDDIQLTTHRDHVVTPSSQSVTNSTLYATPNPHVVPHSEEVSFRSQSVADDVHMTTENPQFVSSKQTYPQAEHEVTALGDSELTTAGTSTPQRKPVYTTMTGRNAAEKSTNKRISDDSTLSGVADGLSTTVSSATTNRASLLPVLHYKHRKVTHNIPLISSLLALAALLSISIGVVMWVIVNRRERARQQDQELTPIATAYNSC